MFLRHCHACNKTQPHAGRLYCWWCSWPLWFPVAFREQERD